jgi:hypothetical protein
MKLSDISLLRQKTFRIGNSITSIEQAIDYVNERGFIFFWPIKDITLPSLWVAVAGDRPVPDKHDDPGHITWRWKDSLLGKEAWYYAKVLRKKATIISMKMIPYFYALSQNFGDPEEDYLILYQQGKLTQEAKRIYETILHRGPLDTISLRKEAHLASPSSDARFNNALADLQADLKIVPIGISEAGAWHYSFVYDLTIRRYPHIMEEARFIKDEQAYDNILSAYFSSVIAAPQNQIQKCFQWLPQNINDSLQRLLSKNFIQHIDVEDAPGKWYILTKI